MSNYLQITFTSTAPWDSFTWLYQLMEKFKQDFLELNPSFTEYFEKLQICGISRRKQGAVGYLTCEQGFQLSAKPCQYSRWKDYLVVNTFIKKELLKKFPKAQVAPTDDQSGIYFVEVPLKDLYRAREFVGDLWAGVINE